jgi:hypothetical protein
MTSMTREVDELLAVTGELTMDEELLEATRKLRLVAVEHDDVDRRFRSAMADVKLILEVRMARSRR